MGCFPVGYRVLGLIFREVFVRVGFLWGVGVGLDLCWNISKVREVDLNSLLFYKADQIRGV